MKCLIRYFSAFLCCLLLFTAFSLSVSAETDDKQIRIAQINYLKHPQNGDYLLGLKTFEPNNGIKESSEEIWQDSKYTTSYSLHGSTLLSTYQIQYSDNSTLFYKGKNYKVSLENFYHSLYVEAYNSFYVRGLTNATLVLNYTNGTTETLNNAIMDSTFSASSPNIGFKLEFSPKYDVKSIVVSAYMTISFVMPTPSSNSVHNVTSYLGEIQGDNSYNYNVEIESEEAGLLKGIANKIDNFFSEFKSKLESLISTIMQLPAVIWDYISNGLKQLFVPSEGFILQFKEDIEALLSDRLGAVYQVINITLESWDGIVASDSTNTIDMPQVSIPLPNGERFSFGGYSVQIVPNGFEFIVSLIKTACGIVCTILFINGLRKRYDEVMGAET